MNKSDTELHGLIDAVVDQIKQDLSKAITANEPDAAQWDEWAGGFTWNYRIVNAKSENGGEDWYCLREVCYDMQGKPTGYGAPCLGSESMETMRDVWDMMAEAMELPPMQEEDFK